MFVIDYPRGVRCAQARDRVYPSISIGRAFGAQAHVVLVRENWSAAPSRSRL